MAATSVFKYAPIDDSLSSWISKTTILNEGEPTAKREEIRSYFRRTCALYEKLFELLNSPLAFFIKAEPLRHPLIFYYGHTACFYMNKLVLGGYLKHRIDPALESMCAVGVDEMSWDDWDVANYAWPSEEEARQDPSRAAEFVHRIKTFRQAVFNEVDHLITTLPLSIPILKDTPFWVIMMGIEHERIHLETSSVIMRRLPIENMHQNSPWIYCKEGTFAADPKTISFDNPLVSINGGKVTQGRPWDETNRLYGWDNEFGEYEADVAPFEVSTYLVSNREYLEFVEDGGYKDSDFWTNEGWSWVKSMKSEKPLFWFRKADNTWGLRLLANEIDMPWDWPVEVNYLEAKAFCNWKRTKLNNNQIRLITSDEWRLLRDMVGVDQPDWEQAPGNINLEYWASSCPVNKFKQTSFGLYDIVGNVWHHTETFIDLFDGFQVHPLYDDFTVPTVDGKHNEIKGGSWISTGNESCKNARYGFRRHFMQHAGFRYVASSFQPAAYTIAPETEASSASVLSLHYPLEKKGDFDCYPKQFAEICVSACKTLGVSPDVAVDICCGPGRVTFELAKYFNTVYGTDLTARLFTHGEQLKNYGRLRWLLPGEGDLTTYQEINVSSYDFASLASRVQFFQMDYQNINFQKWKTYDLISVSNSFENMSNPRLFLKNISNLLNRSKNCVLILAFDGNWKAERCDEEEWLGGGSIKNDGVCVRSPSEITYEAVKKYMNEELKLFEALPRKNDVLCVKHKTGRRSEIQKMTVTFWANCMQNIENEEKIDVSSNIVFESNKTMEAGYLPCDNNYDNSRILNMYIDNHWNKDIHFNIPNYASVCAAKCVEIFSKLSPGVLPDLSTKRVLEIGGAVGRTAFELAVNFGKVISTDYSETFINKVKEFQTLGKIDYFVNVEGNIYVKRNVALEDFGFDKISQKVSFVKMDAMKLFSEEELGGKFDLIFGGNLIDRLPDPKLFLKNICNLLNPNGLLVLSSPYTWLETWTPKENWIGGFKRNAEDYVTLEGLRDFLSIERIGDAKGVHCFEEISPPEDVNFAIRESFTSFQKSVAQMTFWKYCEKN